MSDVKKYVYKFEIETLNMHPFILNTTVIPTVLNMLYGKFRSKKDVVLGKTGVNISKGKTGMKVEFYLNIYFKDTDVKDIERVMCGIAKSFTNVASLRLKTENPYIFKVIPFIRYAKVIRIGFKEISEKEIKDYEQAIKEENTHSGAFGGIF